MFQNLHRAVLFAVLVILTVGCSDDAAVREADPAADEQHLAVDVPEADPTAAEWHLAVDPLPGGLELTTAVPPCPYPECHPSYGGRVVLSDTDGSRFELETRWPSRTDPGGTDDDGPAAPPVTDLDGHAVQIYEFPVGFSVHWNAAAGTTGSIHSRDADVDNIPPIVSEIIDNVVLLDEHEWQALVGGLAD